MIERITWVRPKQHELLSPFMRKKDGRPLRITLHSESLTDLSEEERDVLNLFDELGNLPELEFYQTGVGKFPQILIEENSDEDYIPVQVISNGEIVSYTGIWNKNQWPELAVRLIGTNQNKEVVQDVLKALIFAQAHESVGNDILITKSSFLLNNRGESFISDTNPSTPLEAAQLIGLFLRSRDNYTFMAGSNFTGTCNQHMFYWVLARYFLPNLWRYYSACVLADKARNDDIQGLGSAILDRAVRALQARDAIGFEFYVPQNNDTRDQMMYHFDYLTLVLAGALDAQLRIANRVYHIIANERSLSFRYDRFMQALKQSEANRLYEFVSRDNFQSLLTLLYEPRNTIHGATLKTVAYQKAGGLQSSFVEISQSIGQDILKAAEQLGGSQEWGMASSSHGIWFEPYSYATNLVKETFNAINKIAAVTDVTRLFPSNQVPALTEQAPENSVFDWGKRFALLG